jgi:hypothetical protein
MDYPPEVFYITLPGKPEHVVTKQEWVTLERGAGFSGSGSPAEPSTWSFGGINGVSGRRAYLLHLAGPIRPFAACHSFDAREPHTMDSSKVTCPACLTKMSES